MIKTRKLTSIILLLPVILSCSRTASPSVERESHLSRLASENRWEEICEETRGKLDDYISLNWYNLSKARLGTQTEDLFKVRQHGPQGLLFISKEHAGNVCLAHVMLACGNIAAAQNLAFNALFTDEGYDLTMLKMLCQIEYMRGCRDIGDKYRKILIKDKEHHDWALSAYDDPEIERGKKCLALKRERFVMVDSPFDELLDIIDATASDPLTFQYAMSYLLLSKDLERIVSFVEKYTVSPLPTPAQEAILFYSEYNTNVNGDSSIDAAWCRAHGVQEDTFLRFSDFQQESLKNGGKAPARFTNTFWYYLLYSEI